MPFVTGRTNHASQMEAVVEQRFGLAMRLLIGLIITDQNLDLLGQQAAD